MEIIKVSIMLVAFVVLPMYLAYKIRKSENKNYKLWVLGAFLFGWLAVVLLVILSIFDRKHNKSTERKQID